MAYDGFGGKKLLLELVFLLLFIGHYVSANWPDIGYMFDFNLIIVFLKHFRMQDNCYSNINHRPTLVYVMVRSSMTVKTLWPIIKMKENNVFLKNSVILGLD